MDKIKILFLTTNFPPNPSVGTRRVSKILKYIDHDRYEFHVLTLKEAYFKKELGKKTGDDSKIPNVVRVYRTDKWDFTNIFTRGKAWLKKIRQKNQNQNRSKGAGPGAERQSERKTVEHSVHGRLNSIRDSLFAILEFPDKFIGWLPKAVSEGIKIVNKENIDIILTTAPPHSLFVMALLIKKWTSAKLLLDFRDPWALSRWDREEKKTFSPLYALENRLEALSIKNARLVVFVTEKMRDAYKKHYEKFGADKFKFFPNGFDPQDFNGYPTSVRERDNDRGPLKMVHLGTLYKKRNPLGLLLAIQQLVSNNQITAKELQVDFIGFVARELGSVQNQVYDFKIDGMIRFLPPVSFNESVSRMFDADILLLLQPGTDLQIPAKLFEYMYTRKPIFAIAETNSATEQIIRNGQLGYFAAADNVSAIAEALLKMVKQKNFSPSVHTDFINRFNMKHSIRTFQQYIDEV